MDVQRAGFEHGGRRGVQQALRVLFAAGEARRDVGQAGDGKRFFEENIMTIDYIYCK